jgi:iron uptake system EfeUOB component EfeO/EfeM
LGVYKSDECVGYALLQRGVIIPFDFVNDKQYQIWRLGKLLDDKQQELSEKSIDKNSKEYKKFEEMVNEYSELIAGEMSQAFNTFHEMSDETARRLETIYKNLMQW